MAYISVREEAGAKIIREITNKEAPVLADPVFLLSQDEWDEIAKRDNRLPDKYIVKYILGEKNDETEKRIERYARENHMEVIDIYSRESEFFSMGPAEFVSTIKNAEIVCTNSFHALAFSLIYEKEFVVFNRYENGNDMNSRVDNLLAKFHMESRRIENIKDELVKCDFTESNAVLCREQKKLMEYLRNAKI